jgi:hypothetical protein
MPSASRAEVCARTRELAGLVERSLDGRFDVPQPYDFASVAKLVLMRLAGLARSTATLLERGAELDARMVMRSAVEHMTLLSWLAIDVQELMDDDPLAARIEKAQNPEANTRWWISAQMLADQRRVERLEEEIEGTLDDELRAGFDASAQLFKTERTWGRFPKVYEMAPEADVRWGGAIDGWPNVEPGVPAYTTTLRGFYRLLFQAGNAATHPHLGALVATYTAGDNHGAALVPEAAGEEVDPYVGITAYLLLYAIGVADHALGWDSFDEALRMLGRWDDVRGPGTFLREAHALLDGHEGRRFGAVDGRPVSVERAGAVTSFVVIEESDSWTRIRHVPGPIWSLDDPQGEFIFGPPEMTGPVTQTIALARRQMSTAEWRDIDEADPAWPEGAP